MLGANHWLVYVLGWSASYSGFYHAWIQVGLYMACFIVGFLLTALPRFSSTAPSSSAELLVFLSLFLLQPFCFSQGWWMAGEACFAGVLVALAAFAVRRFARRRAEVSPPTEFVWIPIGILHGVLGTALLILGQLELLPVWSLALGRPMAQQGFLLSMVLGVGGFMGPRLMGRPALLVTPVGVGAEQAHRIRKRRMLVHALAGIVLCMTFFIETFGTLRVAYGLRAALVTAEFLWTVQLHRLPATKDRYVTYLWISFWFIVAGLWCAGLLPRWRVAMLHLIFLGGFSLMTFAVATMVVLSHAGEGQRLRQPLWALNVVGIGLALALAARVSAELTPSLFFPLLGVTAGAWSLAAVSWLVFVLPYVLRVVSAETFERAHEDAKRRLLKTTP